MAKRLVVLLTAVWIMVGLTACSGGKEANQAITSSTSANSEVNTEINTEVQTEESQEASEETHTYTDHFGEVTIPVNPQRLLVLVSRYAEYLVSLGVDPKMVTYVPSVEPEYREKLLHAHGVEIIQYPQYEHNFELLIQLEPDMILTMSAGTEENVYEQLSKIAPTVALSAGPSMDEAMPLLAELFGKEAEYEAVQKDFNAMLDEAREVLQAAIGDSTVMVLRVEPKQYRVLGPNHASGSSRLFYHQLGLKIPDELADLEAWFTPLSLESLPEIDPDYMFIERRVAEGTDTTESWEQLMDSVLWKRLKAVQSGNVFPLNTSDFVGGEGPFGYAHLVEYIISSLVPDSVGAQ